VDATLHALAEPTRREILELVRERELPAGTIAARFDVTRSAISQHLRVLREAGLVTERRDGTRRCYRARPEGLAEVRTYLECFWTDRLAELKREAEHERRRTKDGADRN
jgi:DNA-binding transcriptional ArsR family regulator